MPRGLLLRQARSELALLLSLAGAELRSLLPPGRYLFRYTGLFRSAVLNQPSPKLEALLVQAASRESL